MGDVKLAMMVTLGVGVGVLVAGTGVAVAAAGELGELPQETKK
jgi:hypothetical protein